MNWTGHVVAAPRTRFEAVLGRDELKRTGIYFLIGPDDSGLFEDEIYIGEGDEIGRRLYQHNRDKPFWERFIAITSKDLNLTKAHVRYLEARLLELAEAAKKVAIENKDMPTFDRLPEADRADMEMFLEEIQLILPTIGATFLRKPTARQLQNNESDNAVDHGASDVERPIFLIANEAAGIAARAVEIDGEFVVLSGSRGSMKEGPSFLRSGKGTRDRMFKMGRIRAQNEDNFVLEEDIALSSPSAAAVFLFGTSRNGRTDWKLQGTDIDYGTWKLSKADSIQFDFEAS